MKLFFSLLLLFATYFVHAQCDRPYVVLSPTVGKSAGKGLSVNLEAGIVPYNSKTYGSVKTSMWTETSTVSYTNSKGENQHFEKTSTVAFAGLNYGYVPMAFQGQARKWVLGTAVGALMQEGETGRPAALLSAAYTVHMKAGNTSDGLGCLKLESTCLVSSLGLKPGISAGVFLLL